MIYLFPTIKKKNDGGHNVHTLLRFWSQLPCTIATNTVSYDIQGLLWRSKSYNTQTVPFMPCSINAWKMHKTNSQLASIQVLL